MFLLFSLLLLPMPPMQAAAAAPTVVEEAPTVVACPAGFTCVSDKDMDTLRTIAQNAKCQMETLPQIDADPITIIVDRQGRIYGSGSGPHPFKLRLKWCSFAVEGESNMTLQVASRVEPTWGFRFRPKATFGVLGVEAFKVNKLYEALDGGILLEPFFIQWANLNAYIGVRSFGLGPGFDLTKNFGIFTGAVMTWGKWRMNPFVSAYFAF